MYTRSIGPEPTTWYAMFTSPLRANRTSGMARGSRAGTRSSTARRSGPIIEPAMDRQTAAIGRPGAPALDLPDPRLQPPTRAESGDPFSALRVVHLLARIPRGRPVPIHELVARLNAEYLDWSFSPRVVLDAIAQVQANWIA